MNLSTPGA